MKLRFSVCLLALACVLWLISTINLEAGTISKESLQTPGLATQNAFSFESSSTSTALNTHLILYPTVSNFDFSGGGTVNPPAFEFNNIRVIVQFSGNTRYNRLTYVSNTQINIILTEAIDTSASCGNQSNFIGTGTLKVQKNVGGTWTDIRTGSVTTVQTAPHTNVVYESGSPHINADLYVWDGSSYVFFKKTLDGNPNPRTYNGQPTVLSLYITGGIHMYAANCTGGSYCSPSCAIDLKLNGTISNSYLLSSYVPSGYEGVQQVNVTVPSNITNTTTIQMVATSIYACSGSPPLCDTSTTNSGNIATIPNWQ